MKKILFLAILAFSISQSVQERFFFQQGSSLSAQTINIASTPQSAYNNRQSNVQVRGEGVVTRILSDDVEGSRHQRFILN